MSQKRQTGIFDRLRDQRSHIATLTHDYPAGHVIPLHFHDRDQLVYGFQGVMSVATRAGIWVVPTLRAVWIPAGIPTPSPCPVEWPCGLLVEATAGASPAARLLRGECLIAVRITSMRVAFTLWKKLSHDSGTDRFDH